MSEGGGEMVATFNHAQGLHWHGTTPDSMRAIADIAESTERKAGESGFEIAASADSEFVPAHARIEPSDDLGSDMRVVHLFSPEVPKPTHARYAWRSWGGTTVQRRRPARVPVRQVARSLPPMLRLYAAAAVVAEITAVTGARLGQPQL